MAKLTDEDGIDGPFERRMAAATKADRANRAEAARRFAQHIARANAAMATIRACLDESHPDPRWTDVAELYEIANKLDEVVAFLGGKS